MKLAHTIVECASYSIINYSDSDDHVASNASQRPSFRCFAIGDEWEAAMINNRASLYGFSAACCGFVLRWELLRLCIHDGALCFAFADLYAPRRCLSSEWVVMFDKPMPSFHVEVVGVGASEPDLYRIEYYGKEGNATDSEGEFEIALIEEERNGQRYAGKSILRRGDKYYLSSYRFD